MHITTCPKCAKAHDEFMKKKAKYTEAWLLKQVAKDYEKRGSVIDRNTQGFTDSERQEWIRTHNTITGKPL